MRKTKMIVYLVSIVALAFLVAPSFGQVEIEVDLPSLEILEKIEPLYSSLMTNVAVGGICEDVVLLEVDASAILCINYDETTPYFVALITGTTESITLITVLFDGEIISSSFSINSDSHTTIIPELSAGHYEVLLQQTRQAWDDSRTEVWSFSFEIDR